MSTGSDCKIKRTGVRWLPPVAKGCLHIGFCTLRRRLNGTARGDAAPLSGIFFLISILQAMALQCVSMRAPAFCSPSYALARFDAMDARRLLCWLVSRSIVSRWRGMRAKIFASSRGGREAIEHASIRATSRSSSRSKSQSGRQVAIPVASVRARDRAVAGKEEAQAGSTPAAAARRSLPCFPERVEVEAGNEIPQAASARGGSSLRQGWSGSIRKVRVRGLRRCGGR